MPGVVFQPRIKHTAPATELASMLCVSLFGTIVSSPPFGALVKNPALIKLHPGVSDLLAEYQERHWFVAGICCVPDIALGNITHKETQACLETVQLLSNSAFNIIVYCWHSPTADSLEKQICYCRLPKYGMVVQAITMLTQLAQQPFPLHKALMVGSTSDDSACARYCGIDYKEAEDWRAEALAIKRPLKLDVNARGFK